MFNVHHIASAFIERSLLLTIHIHPSSAPPIASFSAGLLAGEFVIGNVPILLVLRLLM